MLSKTSCYLRNVDYHKSKVYVVCLTILGLFSCQQNPYSYFNRKDTTENGIALRNDSLKFSIKYFADYKFVSRAKRRDLLFARKYSRFRLSNWGLTRRSAAKLITPSTTVFLCETDDPYFKSGAWLLPRRNVIDVLPDSIYTQLQGEVRNYYQDIGASPYDKDALYVVRIYPFDDQYILFIAYTDRTHQSKQIEYEALKDIMINEYTQIFNSISKSD
jgi:hypothetical protein